MPAGGLLTSGVASAASGLISGITGIFQKHKANKLLANLHRPQYVIPNEVLQNQKQAQLNANQGLPSEQYNQGMQNIARQQNSALQRATDRRGGLLAVAGAQQLGNDASLNLDVANANARLKNQNTLYGVNNQVAGYRDKEFQINQLQPYQQKYDYAMGLLGAGNQNLTSGIDKFTSGALMAGSRGGGNGYRPPTGNVNSYGSGGGPVIF